MSLKPAGWETQSSSNSCRPAQMNLFLSYGPTVTMNIQFRQVLTCNLNGKWVALCGFQWSGTLKADPAHQFFTRWGHQRRPSVAQFGGDTRPWHTPCLCSTCLFAYSR